jgi:diguanylate cyclase (GGDEF)-like protein
MALPASSAHNDRRFVSLGVEDGLSDPSIEALAFDQESRLWIGTGEGLNRYDGTTVKVFRRGDDLDRDLGSNLISSLLVTRNGTLWVGTRGGGLSRYQPANDSFETFRNDPLDATSLGSDDIIDLAEDLSGRLWIGTARNGVSQLEEPNLPREELDFVHRRHRDDDPATLSDDRVRDVYADPLGTVWIGTMNGFNRWVPGEAETFLRYQRDPEDSNNPESLPDDEVWALLRTSDGSLWIGFWGGGLSRWRDPTQAPETARFETLPTTATAPDDPWRLGDSRVMTLLEDQTGTLWIGTRGGLHELLATEREGARPRLLHHVKRPHRTQRLLSEDVTCLLEDQQGDLWVGTSGGLARLDRRFEDSTLLYFDPSATGELSGDPSDALLDEVGRLWVTTNTGIDRIELPTDRFESARVTTFSPEPERPGGLVSEAHSLYRSGDGWLWFTTFDGVAALAPEEQHLAVPHFDNRLEGLASDAVLSFLEDSEQALWIGTYRGLHRAERDARGRLTHLTDYLHDPDDPSTLSSRSVVVLADGGDHQLWVGTYFGLNRLDTKTGLATRYLPDRTKPGSLSNESLRTLWLEAPDTLWAGTWGGGLNRFNPETETFTRFGTEEGLPSESIVDMIADGQGRLWLATPRGLVRFDRATGAVELFGSGRGIPNGDIHFLSRAGDRLVVGSSDTVALIPMDGFAVAGPNPRVRLTELRLGNRPILPGESEVLTTSIDRTAEITLQDSDYLLALDFAATAFRQPEDLEYRYRLTGLNGDWITTSSGNRRAVYSTLPPGHYSFEVQARYPHQDWSPEATTLGIEVLPPWWMTWWARSALALSVLTLAILWPLGRLRRADRLSHFLEDKVRERTTELEEANRQLGKAARADYLTGLPNRRGFIERATEEFSSMRRTGRRCAILIADIDDFKEINDTWGHDCGDAILVEVARVLEDGARESDIVARWGGEEFIFLLRGTSLDGAELAGEKIRAAIETHRFTWSAGDEETTIPVAMTIGVAEASPDHNLEAVTSLADAALYRGKRHGKNQVLRAEA